MSVHYSLNKPIILLQHVPLSTKNLIKTAKKHWGNPVVLGMQIHGGIAPNHDSAKLLEKVNFSLSIFFVKTLVLSQRGSESFGETYFFSEAEVLFPEV